MSRRTHRRPRRARAFLPSESLETRLLFAAGEPDTRFSQDGILDVAGMRVLQDVHLAAGEKTLVVGGQSQALSPFTTVSRYTVTGELDPTFSSDGIDLPRQPHPPQRLGAPARRQADRRR